LMNGVFLVALIWQGYATCRAIEELGEGDTSELSGTRQSIPTFQSCHANVNLPHRREGFTT